jgi:hypothetical protein
MSVSVQTRRRTMDTLRIIRHDSLYHSVRAMDNGATLSTNAFADVARDFCTWCEQPIESVTRNTVAASWLCKLYASALSLCQAEPENENGLPEIPTAILAQAARGLSGLNGWYYREYFNPDPTVTDESVLGDVGDDLFDIYTDMRRGLLLYDRGEIKDALWHWEFNFRIHWGRHAVGAIFALHCMAISKTD